jgi:hypothetical protein
MFREPLEGFDLEDGLRLDVVPLDLATGGLKGVGIPLST